MVKKVFYFLLLVLLFGFAFWQKDSIINNGRYLLQTPCDEPIAYRLGQLDPGYKKTEEEFLTQIEQATEIWNQAEGKPLFVYDPAAEIVVNLIYSDRQSIMDKIGQLEEDLGEGKGSLETMEIEYKSLSAGFELRLARFNEEVAYWVEKGGAPPKEYDRLIAEQAELEQEAQSLNQMARHLNLSVRNYNLQVGEFNQSVASYNVAVEQKPEAGLYDGSLAKIDIYLTKNDSELAHTLAHEFGHALGLEHFDDPEAIMYPFSSEDLTASPQEIQILNALCEESRLSAILKEKLAEIKASLASLEF